MSKWESIAAAKGRVPGLTIGYEHTFVHAIADFLIECGDRHPGRADFRTALETQKVYDAIPVGEDRPVGRSGRSA